MGRGGEAKWSYWNRSLKPDLALDRFTIKNIEKRLQVNYFDQRSQLYQVPLKHEAMDMAKSTIMTVKTLKYTC